jgi:sulfite exporter TauE/SafE
MGLLPCGLSWTVFLGAAGTGSLPEGLVVALAFGLGTTPALLLAGAAGAAVGASARGVLLRAGGAAAALLGLFLLLRAAGVIRW